ncbi:N5-carboxyaminoimidazole ribonucleotide synthase [Alicyclobacillus contaminans]|uniref:5-(carboxyamino)imidazole ribonucleotide synthase n=1 Tax=Alicyclobacillus contaminans TaxID=392016 RepID=UPI0004240FD5|nr:5-(carboxyamino)imidazole ribonucleotide synthase [Alicyclobacillus contaminans]GMA50323.1 N5-carboxyaminoimidazole ribonucleotide synthase [Alicyclobacillus contaminans]
MSIRTRTEAAVAKTVLPGATIGILGGGQLGRMMALEARAMGYRIAVLDPDGQCPTAQVADVAITAPYADLAAAERLAAAADVVTYEFENVDAEVTAALSASAYVPQGAELLYTTQHRVREKRALQAAGVPVAPYLEVTHLQSLRQAVKQLGYPAILKTARGGYDGKGQWRLAPDDDLGLLWSRVGEAQTAPGHRPAEPEWILEQFVPFVKELSVMVARSPRGEIAVYPVAENVHVNHILHVSIVPARIPDDVAQTAQTIARQIAESLQLVGVLGVEMFLTGDGEILVNELAPRPHNSGHYTQNACLTSQFEQHVRAICNLPLGDVRLWQPVVMVNILGQHLAPVLDKQTAWPSHWKLHLYGKAEARKNRKMGHINILCDDVETGLAEIRQVGIWQHERRI